jgi:hypothetical protein
MRKYRNGKQSREPRQLSKYSPEYIQYRGNRGGYSVKVGLCDITGDGDADTISVAWRNPANGKVENCTVSIPQAQVPANGPSSLAASEQAPVLGPTSLAASESVPADGPSSLAASEQIAVPNSGPSNLSASESVPASGPSSLAAIEESLSLSFSPVGSPTTESGYVDSSSRSWFSQYDTVEGYVIDVDSSGGAVLTLPDGITTVTLTDATSFSLPTTDSTSGWVVGNIIHYNYLGTGMWVYSDVQVASFDLSQI